MKLVLSTTALFCSGALAGYERIVQEVQNITRFERKQIPNLNNIKSYGCWCHFSDDQAMRQGRGVPVDDLDAQCKVLWEGYQCAEMDALDQGLNCPAEIYKMDWINGGCNSNDNADCEPEVKCAVNKVFPDDAFGDCRYLACMVELHFSEFISANPSIQDDSAHLGLAGSDQYDSTCVGKACKDASCDAELKCCGSYPNRKTYKTLDPNGEPRACCGDRTYIEGNLGLECCTEDGVSSLVSAGSCGN